MVTSLRLIAAGKGVVIAADKWGKIKTISQMIWLNYTLLMLWLFPEAGWAHTVFVVLMGIVVDGAERRQLYAEEQRALQRPVRVELQYKE